MTAKTIHLINPFLSGIASKKKKRAL